LNVADVIWHFATAAPA